MAMAAILNKKFSSAGIFRDFAPGCLVGIQVTFLKISAFYIFSRLNPNVPGLQLRSISHFRHAPNNDLSLS